MKTRRIKKRVKKQMMVISGLFVGVALVFCFLQTSPKRSICKVKDENIHLQKEDFYQSKYLTHIISLKYGHLLEESLKNELLEAELYYETGDIFSSDTDMKSIYRGPQISQETAEAFDKFLSEYDFNVSVYLRFIDDGSVYMYNPDYEYYPASLFKTPLALYLYQADERGEITLSQSDRELARRMISLSDNDATAALARKFGVSSGWNSDNFASYLTSIYVGHEDEMKIVAPGYILGVCDVVDVAHSMLELHRYIQGGSDNALELKEYFLNHEYYPELIVSDYPLLKKFGNFDNSTHDAVLGYEPQPFVLCVMTDVGVGEDLFDPDGIFEAISGFMEEHFLY